MVTLGRSTQEAAGKFFEPLGINNYHWGYYEGGNGVDTEGHLHLTPSQLRLPLVDSQHSDRRGSWTTCADRGNGGQTLFLAPDAELAVVVTAGYYNDERASVADQIFYNVILPSIAPNECASCSLSLRK